ALLGVPVGKMPVETIQRIVAGGQAVCDAVGIPIAGGHSIDSTEPIYGLVALGLVHPDRVKRNDRARPGDVLILGKALGVGIMSAALKKGELTDEAYRELVRSTTKLNTPGIPLAEMDAVHAITDVTGFGLLGHLMEVCRGSGLKAEVRLADVPLLPFAAELAQRGYVTGASDRNWAACESAVRLPPDTAPWLRKILTDPQTSGGLLVACAPDAAEAVLEIFAREGFEAAQIIGSLERGEPGITVV
ncbi:MAG: selenide, water dikinase SelD, partial [Burkholderiales bacterium]